MGSHSGLAAQPSLRSAFPAHFASFGPVRGIPRDARDGVSRLRTAAWALAGKATATTSAHRERKNTLKSRAGCHRGPSAPQAPRGLWGAGLRPASRAWNRAGKPPRRSGAKSLQSHGVPQPQSGPPSAAWNVGECGSERRTSNGNGNPTRSAQRREESPRGFSEGFVREFRLCRRGKGQAASPCHRGKR